MSKTLGLVAAAAVVFVSGASAQEQQCPPRAHILKTALTKYGEGPVGAGGAIVKNVPYVFELMLSAEGSWTMMRTGADGTTCVLASGTGWETTGDPPLPGEPS